jgi:hypothetical protein
MPDSSRCALRPESGMAAVSCIMYHGRWAMAMGGVGVGVWAVGGGRWLWAGWSDSARGAWSRIRETEHLELWLWLIVHYALHMALSTKHQAS